MPVPVVNLEVGVHRALVAYFKERGASDDLAKQSADAHLIQAVVYIKDAFSKQRARIDKRSPDSVCWSGAFQDLKRWAVAIEIERERVEAEAARERAAEDERQRAETEKIERARRVELFEAEGRERAVTEEMETEHLAELIEESSAPKAFEFDLGPEEPVVEEVAVEADPVIEELFPAEAQPIEPAKKKSKKKK